ncbi:ABC transporter substrate-binding protein [Paenibacillus sp. MY03]|uniref:TIM-barrel domain-containing protein n=1 Tax=Paenibacillus sp. MY03 TaxID=302980 RepID=UPI000B3C0E40|nr:TIM-barrel domain-containing protein [Paenibacillus sp. MY03]OUS73958.1 ABC transporter substrate-binding protein [Paenibacillus sp. MY03]
MSNENDAYEYQTSDAATSWKEVAPGVWRLRIGSPEGLSPLALIGAEPDIAALGLMEAAPPPFRWSDITVEECGNNAKLLVLPLDGQERLYGTGLQFMRSNQRGRTRYLRVNSDPKQDTGETHAPVPFYVSDKGYGVLVDTSRIVTMHLGSTLLTSDTDTEWIRDRNLDPEWRATMPSPRVEIKLPSDGAFLYVFGGPKLRDAVARYNLYCGGGALPPKWGLGFWHRLPTLHTDEEALREALEYRERDVPCDVIGLEPGWHSRSYPVTGEWDGGRFPDPPSFVRRMGEAGFRINLWEHPYLSPDSGMYSKLRPMSGSHTVWGGIAPDYALTEARAAYKEHHLREHVSLGVAGYKLDECDGSELTNNAWMFPDHARFPSGLDGESMRQLYGLMFQKMTYDLYRAENRRTYGLVRASGAGASSLPYALYSDLYDHKQFIRALCNASYCGLLWTPEVRKARNAEDWARRMQTVCFSPLAMLNAWGDGTKPWSFPEVEGVVRHYIRLRMRLLPYLYTAFAEYREKGIPPIRAMSFEIPPEQLAAASGEGAGALDTTAGAYGKRKAKEWDDQYMYGNDMVVAPLVEGESEREVLLPEGVWYGLESGIRYIGGGTIRVASGVEHIPVFVREGAIIPMMPPLSHVPANGAKTELHLVHFGDAPGMCMLYDDDGETYDYERGGGSWHRVSVVPDGTGVLCGRLEGEGELPPSYSRIIWHLRQTSLV